ncbi:MAG: LPXTG cell wall anchor domain-containing protein [Clostridiales bacterium]|nr:LPXTG cell wall anchor domain-containing protein [Clostridiales bacterium]
MKNIVSFYVEKFKAEHRKARRMTSLLLALALVVSTGVFWQLHATGIALTNETYCGLEEHTHTEDCCEKVLVCELEESEGHTHTKECYEERLICGLEEHTHTISCMSDETADVETTSDWEKTLPKLTGVWVDDVVSIAKSQIGYTESTANFVLDDDGATRRGYTRYGEWAGNEYGDWDAMFASFCLYYAGVDKDDFPEATGAYAWSVKLEKADLYGSAADYDPAAGDLVFFDTDSDKKIDRVGVVIAVDEKSGKLTVVEGDSNDAVEKNTYSASDSTIKGYGVLPEQPEDANTTKNTEKSADTQSAEDTADAEAAEGEADASTSEEPAATNTLLTASNETVTYTAGEVQALVDALPTAEEVAEMDSDEQLEVYTQLQTAYDAYETLPAEDQVSMDVSVIDALFAYFNGQVSALAAGNIDILDYIASYGESHYGHEATARIIVSDVDGNVVESDQYGDYNLIAGEAYSISIDFYFEAGMDAGTYVYTFPEGVTLGEGSGYVTIVDSSGTERTLGTWSIDSATCELTFDINNLYDLPSFSHITLSASVSATFENGGEEITIGDITYQVIEETEEHSASLHKRAVEINEDDNTISWVIEVDGGDNVGLAEQTITDIISTDTHEYLQDNIDSLTIEIQAADGEYHTLSINDVKLDWSESGWEITLPDSFECVSCRETITLPKEDSTGWIVYIEYTTSITSSSSYVTYGNTVDFYDLEEKGKISTGEGGIDKGGVYNEGATWEDTTITWTVDAFIPGGKVYNWYIYDSEDVVIGSSRQQRYYNDLGVDSTTTTITAQISGQEDSFNVPNIADAANDGSDLIAWELHGTAITDGYEYGRTIRFYCWDSENGEWSRWWNIGSDTYLTITYTSSVVYEDENLIQEYNATGASLRNSVQLQNQGTPGGTDNLVDEASAKVDLPSVIDKELTIEPDSDNDWVTQYTVTFNEAMADLSVYDEVVITDTMSTSLIYDKGSTVLTAKDANGNTFTVTDYTVSFSSGTNSNVATITLNDSALGPYEYTLVYNAKIDGRGRVTYSNAINVTVFGKTFTDKVGAKVVNDVSASGQTYSVTLTKKDADTGATLAGAEFRVCNAETDAFVTAVTTGNDGTATVKTNTSEGIILHAHTLYYFIETKAPDGYQLDSTTKYYFWFCNVDGECSTCDAMKAELIAKEGADVNVHEGAFDSSQTEENITITVYNEPGVELPHTGGTGTWLYSLTGLVLCSGAGLTILRRRRKTAE